MSHAPGAAPHPQNLYKAGIAAMQAHCLRVHGRRFQALPTGAQLDLLSLLESGQGFGGIAQFQVLASMLVDDAAQAHFAAASSYAHGPD